ncbi:MAG: efflux RND transporter periplasmic adaptor subunit [Balneolaceae bacterium]|nr:efflux RND transporter periplasmic adaptor subunit [Balneolaceae bacterium]MBO6545143.1 efflux RND transporter periplasmic adaptor subunit [Balneolaceae bacterium]MBO6646539.1 efflux RND transporter periplasmic adaptor subunit [Balneolaceae bacterium]
MKTEHIYLSLFSVFFLITAACAQGELEEHTDIPFEHTSEVVSEEESTVHLSELKFNALGIKLDTLRKRSLSNTVRVNGQLEVPPQHEATVTSVLGANIVSIEVIEGDFVTKNQIVAYLSHPNLIQVQTEYVRSWRQMNYLEREYQRQKRLYDEEIGSGQQFQQTEAEYEATRAEVKGSEARLRQLNLNAEEVRSGTIYERIPVVSPIEGYVEDVGIQIGQYVDPQATLFEIINVEHIHADFMVYEKDVRQLKKGQQILFTVESGYDEELVASIYSIGKKFEQEPKAVHVHAEIDDPQEYLIPGMYIRGSIQTSSEKVWAIPEDAIVTEDGKSLMFLAEKEIENGEVEWKFIPLEISTGIQEGNWVEVKLFEPLPENAQVVMNNAYYLISEMKKSETGHDD